MRWLLVMVMLVAMPIGMPRVSASPADAQSHACIEAGCCCTPTTCGCVEHAPTTPGQPIPAVPNEPTTPNQLRLICSDVCVYTVQWDEGSLEIFPADRWFILPNANPPSVQSLTGNWLI